MTGRNLADGLEFTCSVLRRHNGLKHDWYYEKDGLWARAETIGSAAAQAAGSQTGGSQLSAAHETGRIDGTSAAVAATVSAATAATERAAAAATAANAAALATGKTGTTAPTAAASQASAAPVRPAAADTASRERAAAPVTTASSAASGAAAARPAPADPSIPYTSAASVRRPDRDDENRGGAPWLLWGAGAATLALAGLFMYKGMTVKPVEKVEPQAAAVAPAAAPETKVAEEKPVVVADAPAPAPEPAPAPAEEAPAAAAEPESPPPATEPGATSFYGVSDSSRVMAWSAEATFNPDYTTAAAEAPAEVPAEAPVAQAEPEPSPAPAAAEPEPAPVAAEPEPEPYKTEPGQTSYYGIAEKADATQLWAAPATVFADAEPAPAPAPEPTSEPTPEAAPAPAAAEPAPEAAAEPEAEPYKTEPGVTSYYGIAEKADATQPWSAPATVYAEPEPAPAPAPEPAPVEAAAEPEPAAEPYKTEPGQTSFYGLALKPDATQAWAAPATVYAEAEPAAAPSPAANACSDALAAALKAGTLNFATSSWQILSNSYATLDEIAKQAKACEGVAIEVGGHTDSTGLAAGNKTLSERRANAVMNYLIKAGVPATSITAVGYGQDKPVATNDTADGKRQNRRIEFTVTSK